MLYKEVWISFLSILIVPTAAKLNARAASPSASSSAQIILANEAAPSYNPNNLLPTQMSSLYQVLQVSPTATPSATTTPAILYDAAQNPSPLLNSPIGSFTAATTPLVGGLAGTSTGILIPPQINNPLTAAPPPPAATKSPLYFGSEVPVNGYYVAASNAPPYPIANATTGLGISPGSNITGIEPFMGQGCGRWELVSRWQRSMMMICSAALLLARLFL